MNDKNEIKKKKSASAEAPVHTIREGAVAAFIWRRQSPSGFAYFDFELKRTFRSLSSGSTGTSRNFFVCNQQELFKVIEQATTWIATSEKCHAPGESIAA